jgi:hypothetical protein
MKLLVFYRPDSEHARQVEEFLRDLQRQHDIDTQHLDILDVDSREGMAMASLYDVVMYPSIVVVADDGSMIRSWAGEQLPLMNEIASYTFAY